MHGCNSGPTFLVNAEVDSMGGVVDCRTGKGLKTSHQAAVEKAQAELRQECDVREERRRELEFLEKGGNPLDFKFGNAASVSVQSTSLTDQRHEQFVTSEAKGSFALAASPHGDSVDSSARPVAPLINEPNTADNLLLFDRENASTESKRRTLHLNRRNHVAPSEHSSKIGGSQNAKESEDSAIFRPYARRNRSRPNHGPRGASRDGKGLTSEANSQKVHNLSSASKPKPASLNGDVVSKDLENDLDHVRTNQTGNSSISVKEDKCVLPSQDDTAQNSVVVASREANVVESKELAVSDDHEPPPFTDTTKCQNEICSGQPNGFGNIKVDRTSVLGMKNFDSESSCTQTCLVRYVNNDNDIHTGIKNVDADGSDVNQAAEFEKKLNLTLEVVKENNKTNNGESNAIASYNHDAGCQNHCGTINIVKDEEDVHVSSNDSCNRKEVQHDANTTSKTDKGSGVMVDHCCSIKDSGCVRHSGPMGVSISEPQAALAEKANGAASDCGPCSSHLKSADKANEDFILEEARIIEAKRRRIAELSIQKLPSENQKISHWGFVLEEMAWLANDFAQERLWKTTVAAQLCRQAVFTYQIRYGKQNKPWESTNLAHSMAKAVMKFWHSVEHFVDNDDPSYKDMGSSLESGKVYSNEASSDKNRDSNVMLETSKGLEGQSPRKIVALKLQAYALRFLKYNSSLGISSQTDSMKTPERMSVSGDMDMSWEELLTEENLFYTVPPMAIHAYRKSVEYHFLQFERTGSGIQEEVETSLYDPAAEAGSEEIACYEDEGETCTYYLHAQKKNRNMKSHAPGSCDKYTVGTQPSTLFGRRPGSLNVGSVPTKRKRKRMVSRQRVVNPFMVTGTMQALTKADASSGDTSSFQDDQSTLHSGLQILKSMDVSVEDLEKQLPSDCVEISFKPKKKAKNLVSAYDQRWQLDSVVLNEQRDLSKKRLDDHHFESNGLYRQHNAKKPKIAKQSFDNTFDNISPMANSIPSPAASQMSNMSNLSKSIKIITGRKAKTLKISAGQLGSGGPWSLFEDQALVVLVHDMGPNWELVSDAINSTLQFKYIFREPKECKERHRVLMDKSAGDGADSAEDSGSSQSYPYTLPGIPKGSARQLFQRLQGPMEEDTIKSHFEKIIKIGQKYHLNQNDNQDVKQITSVHNSHVIALSQVFPNNLNGGLLTPLDLCDINAPAADSLSLGYQGSYGGGGLLLPNQGSVMSALPTSGASPALSGSSGMVPGNNLSSPSGPAAASARYGVPRTSPLSFDEQQRIQQYNQMLSGRNIRQPSMSIPGSLSVSERSVHMFPSGNGVGVIGGINRNMGLSRSGFQGMASSPMVSSGSMLASNMTGMPSPVNKHSGVNSGQGNSMLRPHETHMIRPGHNPEHQRQVVIPEIQMQVTQGNSQGISAFSGLSSSFSNQTAPTPAQPYPGQVQQPHQLSQQQSHLSSPHSHPQGPNHSAHPQQQAYAMRLAKERQLHQQRYPQQQQQFTAPNALRPHAQAQSELPMSSSLQNNTPVQSQNSSQQVIHSPVTPSSPLTPMSSLHQQQKHHMAHGFSRNPGASGLNNQAVKQRQRPPQQQQHQQSGRQHPNQRQHPPSQQQAKLVKGIGRGSISVQQNISIDSSHVSGLSVPPTSQTADKGDQITHMIRVQHIKPVSNLNPTQPSKPLGPALSSNHSQLQQNLNSGPTNTSSKQLQPMASPDNSTQGQVPPVRSGHVISSPKTAVSSAVLSSADKPQRQQQSQLQSNKMNQTQNAQRMLQRTCQLHCESSSKPQPDSTQADQPAEINASQISKGTAVTHGCVDSSSVVTVIPTMTSQRRNSEAPFDSHVPTPATQVGSLGKAPVRNSVGNGPQPTISQGQGPRQLSFVMPHVHNSVAQRRQQPLPIQQSSSQPILSQQPHEPHKQHQRDQD
ncbi:LOW QUALITY PROTEIN: chromatin modification-related protein EAF1 B-like [Prosopis cineraria]|uniref:LOW QUALITY PROTEIN: chromatin modification-related protein EAF1 B-like n=1 Tax=Prosopis cineraria TaxID=364024 RepID=UPI002410536D|nr:LOW QUALITY PROTEIN: chromatin modification-related protein EAF1 B-like [Prosopis cineraria]